jgi:transcriptional regulator with XRE-family HTH domain
MSTSITLTRKEQLRAARALLGWSQETLAAQSGVSVPTIKRLEPGSGKLASRLDTVERLQRALEGAGVVFSDGDGPGVTLVQR